MDNPAPGFTAHPDHTISISPHVGTLDVVVDGTVIATTKHALVLEEASYPPVIYLPFGAFDDALLMDSDKQTWCPFKGHASYYHLVVNGQTFENAIWYYETPFDEVEAIKGHVAVYPQIAKASPRA